MLAQMQQQEEQENAQDKQTNGQTSKREKIADTTAAESQRRATRGSVANGTTTAKKEEQDATPRKRQGRPKKSDTKTRGGPKKQTSDISSYFSKEDLEKKAGHQDVGEALKESAEEDKDNVKTSDIGMTDLKSARQPKLVTGGTMRSYQLEGLEWMVSLYLSLIHI